MRVPRFRSVGLAVAVASAALLGERGARSQPDAGGPSGRAPELEAAVRALVGDRELKDAQIGVVIMDAESGAILAQNGEHTVLNPASNAKLYTAAAALGILHGSHRYQTTVSGTIKSGGASGVVLRGHGDPSLRSSDLWAMVQEVKAHGARRVDGDLLVEQKFFDDQTTPPAFDQQPNEWASFRAPVSAVALNGNTVTLTVRPTTSGNPAIAFFDPPGFVDVEGGVKTGEEGADTVGLDLAPNGKRLAAKLSGTIGADAKIVRYTRRVEDPQLLAGYALKAILDEAGLKVGGDVKLGSGPKEKAQEKDKDAEKDKDKDKDKKDKEPDKDKKDKDKDKKDKDKKDKDSDKDKDKDKDRERSSVLAKHESEPLSVLLYALGKNSDNFVAEMIFKSLAAEAKGRPAKAGDAAAAVTQWVDKYELGDAGFSVKNGSGLFDSNRTTAFSMAKLLRFAWREPSMKSEFVAQLAIGGVDGTLHKRFRDARLHRAIRAKTGTLDDAIALSGYVLGPGGKSTIAFAILFNHVSGHGGAARAAADKLVELIHERQWR